MVAVRNGWKRYAVAGAALAAEVAARPKSDPLPPWHPLGCWMQRRQLPGLKRLGEAA